MSVIVCVDQSEGQKVYEECEGDTRYVAAQYGGDGCDIERNGEGEKVCDKEKNMKVARFRSEEGDCSESS